MKRVSTAQIRRMAADGQKIVMVTCYDATFARLVDEGGADVVLVGDSVGMVVQGHDTTLPVTVEDIVYHTRAVVRGCRRPHIVADLPFGSYQGSPDEAVANAIRLVKDGGAQAVKLEGGAEWAPIIRRMVAAGVPVMGHLGLTPQSVHQFGGFKIQGRTPDAAERLRHDAQALAEAGCYALVLEGIPAALAAELTAASPIPTIGIGAGPGCHGQVLVLYDLLGLNNGFTPKFVKKFETFHERVVDAVANYAREVRAADFPTAHHSHT